MQEIEVLMHCPSFSHYSLSSSFVDVAAEVAGNGEENDGHDNEDDFEFAFVNRRDGTNCSLPITATDQIFSNDIIFPIFNKANFEEVVVDKNKDITDDNTTTNKIRKVSSCPRLQSGRLFMKEFSSSTSSSSTSSSETNVDLTPYWKPKTFTTSPDHTYCPDDKKSKSFGRPKSFRLRDLIRRSNSNLNNLANHAQPLPSTKEDAKPMNRKLSAKKVSGISVSPSFHEMHYLRNKATKDGDKRRSFLPYKRDLIGFFGFSRKLHPFA